MKKDFITKKYILDDAGNPKEESDLIKWGKWLENSGEKRRVAYDIISKKCAVSTVFLGLDHNYSGVGLPILFETMVFGMPEDDEECERYCTREEAIIGHKKILKKYQRKYQKI